MFKEYTPALVRTDLVAYDTLEELIQAEASSTQLEELRALVEVNTPYTLTIVHLLEVMEAIPSLEKAASTIFDFSKVVKVVVMGQVCYIYLREKGE